MDQYCPKQLQHCPAGWQQTVAVEGIDTTEDLPTPFAGADPVLLRKLEDSDPIAPRVSKAKGINKKDFADSWAYFRIFRRSASAATALDSDLAMGRYEGAKVSQHVASQISSFPHSHGTKVIPSGLLPSDLKTSVGSRRAGTLAETRDLQMMLLRDA